ncbi:sulfotransferase family 2 domain-containing protein [Roseicyclus marinus]|uniref:sulfotransferase family 2 domain-containing protein n=1 Tax=Roseicyclus marinus TaxID=2161673 RepID=UPI0024109794|nr:sulfotransferase family 2 domain-containing protein [Roseicyclus marinus]MDG3042677.1 sulfotransferase family 2 domain-containing protein [Roseicyclus marinus]
MPYTMPAQRMAFFFSPKAGGTSLRAFLFHAENGFAFRDYSVQGTRIDANMLAANYRFNRIDHGELVEFRRFALVRDPVRRFLSGYSNRVLHYRELSIEAAGRDLLREGLPPDPDIETFIENYVGYLRCSKPLARHFLKQQKFIGNDPSYFERIFRLERVGELVDFVNAECGTNAVMPRLQTGGPKLDFGMLNEDLQIEILKICRHDIAFRLVPDYWAPYAHLLDSGEEFHAKPDGGALQRTGS